MVLKFIFFASISSVKAFGGTHSEASLNQLLNETDTYNCAINLASFEKGLNNSFQKRFYTKSEANRLIADSSRSRILLRQRLLGFNAACDEILRKIFIEQRDQEDYWALNSDLHEQLNSAEVDFKKQPVPLKEQSTQYENYVTAQGSQNQPFIFSNGDIMVTRGVSWFSSTIAHATSNKNHFSHGVFVFKDAKNIEHTIESYIGSGVKLYAIEEALRNENARIQVYRFKGDMAMADLAGKTAFEQYVVKRKVNYDYDSDFSSDRSLTCVEIPFWSYKKASGGRIEIPLRPSTMKANSNNLLANLGLRSGSFFAPSDLELDPRFELVAEWADYRLVKENMIKDVVSEKLVQWTSDLGYTYSKSLKSRMIDNDVVKAILVFFGLAPKDLPKSYAVGATMIISASEKLYALVSGYYELQVQKARQGLSGYYPPTKKDLLKFLEYVRVEDQERKKTGRGRIILDDIFEL